MKRLVRVLFLAGMLMALLCVTAMAANEKEGIFAEKPAEGSSATLSNVNKDDLTVTVPAQSSAQYLVLVLSDGSKSPTASNIVYIDQAGANESSVSFHVYPSQLANDTTYHIYITSDKDSNYNGLTEVATFQYYQSYTLGDVDNNGNINSVDALMTLQYGAELIELTETQKLAANVQKDGYINSVDALKILQYGAGLILTFD